jgi:hypothetical protein
LVRVSSHVAGAFRRALQSSLALATSRALVTHSQHYFSALSAAIVGEFTIAPDAAAQLSANALFVDIANALLAHAPVETVASDAVIDHALVGLAGVLCGLSLVRARTCVGDRGDQCVRAGIAVSEDARVGAITSHAGAARRVSVRHTVGVRCARSRR